MSRKTLVESASENITPEFLGVYKTHINRANMNVRADKDLYQEISALMFSHYEGSTLSGHTIGLSFEPVTPRAVRESNRHGGNPGGWQEVNQMSLKAGRRGDPAINFRSNWDNAADDAVAMRMDDHLMEKVTEMTRKRDALMPNQWVKNAAENADVIDEKLWRVQLSKPRGYFGQVRRDKDVPKAMSRWI